MKRFNEGRFRVGDSVFDGFAHRGFREELDGWMNEMPHERDYPGVTAAWDVILLFRDFCDARRRIWQLEQEVKMLKDALSPSAP